MSSAAKSRLQNLVSHFVPSSSSPTVADASNTYEHRHNFHTLSPTYFLPRAAAVEPEAEAIYHITANGKEIKRNYQEFADRARAVAYFVRKRGYGRVGLLCPNTPAFLECVYGIAAASAVNVAVNYRLKPDDVSYIFQHSDVDAIIVDAEYEHLLADFRKAHPRIPIIVDIDTDCKEGPGCGEYDRAVNEGFEYDRSTGGKGWSDLETSTQNEEDTICLAYTSGTTARPKGVEYTHRGVYLAAMGNVVESGLNVPVPRCRYLWTLPMFHAMGWTFAWAIVAVRGTNYCLRKIDYPEIWRLLKDEKITHYNAAPTVNTLLCADKSAKPLDHPVRVTVAASPPSAHLFETMTNLNLHPVHVYGMTETYGPITKGYIMPSWDALPIKDKYAKMARQGHGFVTSEAVRVIKTDLPEGQIVDVKRDGEEIGEIIFTGNICAKGYYKDAEATRKLWAGNVLHSGDLAVWHPDGAIQILDRAKDIIISGGENISSVALESMIITHPDILEAAIVAIKDEKWGERPKAYITVREDKTLSGPDVIKWAKQNSNISGFMVPAEVEIMKELPKTSTGKVQKNVLREWAKKGKKAN